MPKPATLPPGSIRIRGKLCEIRRCKDEHCWAQFPAMAHGQEFCNDSCRHRRNSRLRYRRALRVSADTTVYTCRCGTPFQRSVRGGPVKIHCSDLCRQQARAARRREQRSEVRAIMGRRAEVLPPSALTTPHCLANRHDHLADSLSVRRPHS